MGSDVMLTPTVPPLTSLPPPPSFPPPVIDETRLNPKFSISALSSECWDYRCVLLHPALSRNSFCLFCFKVLFYCIVYSITLFVCVSVYAIYVRHCWRPEEGTGSSGAGVTDGCELPATGAGSRTLTELASSTEAVYFLTMEPSLQFLS